MPMLTNPDTRNRIQFGIRRRISAKTANYTILEGESGTVFTNGGAGGEVVFTLPTPASGLFYYVIAVAAQNVVVKPPTADTMMCFNDIAADQIAFNTANEIVGGGFMFTALDGTNWSCQELIHDAQTSVIAT